MAKLSKAQHDELLLLADDSVKELARQKLHAFISYTKEDFESGWHNQVMCAYLDLWIAKKIKRLMIFMPPRHGKSEAVSRRMPAFIFGRHPDAQIIATTYGADLSSSMNRDVQRIMDTPEYLDLFPKTTLSGQNVKTTALGSWLRNSEEFEVVGHNGKYRCAGVGGGITGKGADYFIIDDPIKNSEEADSPTIRETHWNWYNSTAYTRLEKDACMLITMTRWHENDLAGRLLEQSKNDKHADQWTILALPGVLDNLQTKNPLDPRQLGESLWPWKYPEDRLRTIKAGIGTRFWEAMYQQRPAALEGGLIKNEWLANTFSAEPDHFDEMLISMDCSFKGNDTSDFTCIQVWGRVGANKYLLDLYRKRVSFTEAKRALETMSEKWPKAYAKIVEDTANGPAIIDALKDSLSGIIGYSPKQSKVARLNAVAPDFEAGNIKIPARASWLHDYIHELTTFPNAANDDQVDATTQALLRFKGKVSGDFSERLIPKSNKTISSRRGSPQW